MIKLTTNPFDAAAYLDEDEATALYLTEALETGDEALIIDAIGVVARAKGMGKDARKAYLARTSLYRGLSKDGKPQFGTILKTLKAMDIDLVPKVS